MSMKSRFIFEIQELRHHEILCHLRTSTMTLFTTNILLGSSLKQLEMQIKIHMTRIYQTFLFHILVMTAMAFPVSILCIYTVVTQASQTMKSLEVIITTLKIKKSNASTKKSYYTGALYGQLNIPVGDIDCNLITLQCHFYY